MKASSAKKLICPNCFGQNFREVLATATSRNIIHDDSAPPLASQAGVPAAKRAQVVKRLCVHCGHEVGPDGGTRA